MSTMYLVPPLTAICLFFASSEYTMDQLPVLVKLKYILVKITYKIRYKEIFTQWFSLRKSHHHCFIGLGKKRYMSV